MDEGKRPTTVVVMGATASGKTTVARALADRLGWPFVDGDALQPRRNIERMAAGIPLTDSDRGPWLAAVAAWIDERATADEPGIVVCSALRRAYRDRLRAGRPSIRFVHLAVPEDELRQRLATRRDHFMPPGLLRSQLETLEPPSGDEPAITIDADRAVPDVVDDIMRGLRDGRP